MDLKEYWRGHRDHRDRQRRASESERDDLGDTFRAMAESRREVRAHQFKTHHEELKKCGVPYEVKNHGHHVILEFGKEKADFWPASGKYFLRSERRYGIGFHRLFRHFNKEQ